MTLRADDDVHAGRIYEFVVGHRRVTTLSYELALWPGVVNLSCK